MTDVIVVLINAYLNAYRQKQGTLFKKECEKLLKDELWKTPGWKQDDRGELLKLGDRE